MAPLVTASEPEDHLLRRAAAQALADLTLEIAPGMKHQLPGREMGDAHRLAPRLDGDLVETVFRVEHEPGERVPGLVHRHRAPLVIGGPEAGALLAQQHPIAGELHVAPGYGGGALPRRGDSGLVHQVGKVGPAGLGHEPGQPGQVDIVGERDAALAHVQAQDRLALRRRGEADGNRPIEPAGPKQGRVRDPPAGWWRRSTSHMLARREAVHLDQELVQRAVVLVMALVSAPAAAQRVDLVDEDDAAGLPGLTERAS